MANFKAAERNAYNIGWEVTNEQSPDSTLLNDIVTLRERSHQLIRDNPVVAGFQQTYINNIISYGPTIYSASKNNIQRKQINDYLAKRLDYCDVTGSKSIYKILEEWVSCAFADGDVLINLPMVDGQTVVETVEAFRIDTPYTKKTERDNILVRHGVEYYPNGVLKGFWVKKPETIDKYYATGKEAYDFFPVFKEANGFRRRVTDLFKAPLNSRPMASRQYPIVTPAIPFIKSIDDFNEATIIGARVAACFSAFVTVNNPAQAQKSLTTDVDPRGTTQKVTKMQPGSIFYLNKNETINFASPNKPGDNYDSFMLRSYKTISMCMRVPYILAFLDTDQVSYSSWRGAVLDSFKMVKRWRRELDKILKWVVSTFILEGIANGEIRGDISTADLRVRWPSVGVLDVEKEERGNQLALENGTKSIQMACDEQGTDYEEVRSERLQERLDALEDQALELKKKKELSEKYGIEFPEESQSESRSESGSSVSEEEEKKKRRKDDGNW